MLCYVAVPHLFTVISKWCCLRRHITGEDFLFPPMCVSFNLSFLVPLPLLLSSLEWTHVREWNKRRSYMYHKVILWCMVRQITSDLKQETVLDYSGHTFTHVIPLVLFSAYFFCQILFVIHHCCLHFVSFWVFSYMYFLSVSVALLNIL